jgi:acyl carrier protein
LEDIVEQFRSKVSHVIQVIYHLLIATSLFLLGTKHRQEFFRSNQTANCLPMQKFNVKEATPDDIRQHAFSVVSEVSGISIEDLDKGMSIADDIAPNSIDRITLFMALEDEFGESIPESEVGDIGTLQELLDFVESRVRKLQSN